MQLSNFRGWVVIGDLGVPDGGGVRIEYLEGATGRWFPACIFANLDEESLFAPTDFWTWHRATITEGIVFQRDIKDAQVFWNYFVNFQTANPGVVRLRITVFGSGGDHPETAEVDFEPKDPETIFLNNWLDWRGGSVKKAAGVESGSPEPNEKYQGWLVGLDYERRNFLTIQGKEKLEPIHYNPGLNGSYDVYLGIKEYANFRMEMPGSPYPVKIFLHPKIVPKRTWKEIFVGSYVFAGESRISLVQAPGTTMNPLLEFGGLGYIKLAPSTRSAGRPEPVNNGKEIMFCSEPWSLAYYGDLQNEEMALNLIAEYKSLGVGQVNCQVGRFGSEVIYPSRIVFKAGEGAAVGDDLQSSDGINEMKRQMDVLEVLARLCRREGLRFTANLGINQCDVGTAAESRFSREHPEYHHYYYRNLLDFRRPEVRDHFCAVVAELAEYDLSGIGIDYCRYHFGQTEDTLTAVHREMKGALSKRRKQDLEITVRIPVNCPEYFQAFKIWCREDLADIIIPSNHSSCYPAINLSPYLEIAHKYRKKVYGCIDGWTLDYGGGMLLPRPAEVIALAKQYYSLGADGLFFYQSEGILDNIFLRRVIPKLKGI